MASTRSCQQSSRIGRREACAANGICGELDRCRVSHVPSAACHAKVGFFVRLDRDVTSLDKISDKRQIRIVPAWSPETIQSPAASWPNHMRWCV